MDEDISENKSTEAVHVKVNVSEQPSIKPFPEGALDGLNLSDEPDRQRSEHEAKMCFLHPRHRFTLPEGKKESHTLGKMININPDSVIQPRRYLLNTSEEREEEDDHIYTSETELDAFCNQSDSIEADQYKMDPEVDQLKDEDMDKQIFVPHAISKNAFQTKTENKQGTDLSESFHTSPLSSLHFDADTTVLPHSLTAMSQCQKVYSHPEIAEGVKFLFNLNKESDIIKSPRSEHNDISDKREIGVSDKGMLCWQQNENLKMCEREYSFFNAQKPNIRKSDLQGEDYFQKLILPRDDFEGMKQELQKLIQLSSKHISDREFYNEAQEIQLASFAIHNQLSSCDESVMTKCKEMLPFSHKYLMESVLRADSFENTSKPDIASLMADNKILQFSLEEETIKRKHCEKLLENLNKKVMDLQQKTAVAISLDATKDNVIKEIDKMLSKNIERWKTREEEQLSAMEKISNENRLMRNIMKKQQDALLKSESHIKELSDKMREEKERSERENKELTKQVQNGLDELAIVQGEKIKEVSSLKKKLDDEQRSRSNMEKEFQDRLSSNQSTFELEKLKWKSNEAKLEADMKALQEEFSEKIEFEKMRSQKLQNIIEELNMSASQLKNDKSLLETKMLELNTEKEQLKSTTEALEDKYKLQYNEMHKELSIKARKEVADVTQKLVELHKWEIEELMRSHMEEIETVKMQCNVRCNEAMRSLSLMTEEMKKLKEENEVLGDFRRAAGRKMQLMLQVHQEEALKLFGVESITKPQEAGPSNKENKDVPQRNLLSDLHDDFMDQKKQDRVIKYSEGEGDEHFESFVPSSAAINHTSSKERKIEPQPKGKTYGHTKLTRKCSRHINSIPGKTENSSNHLADALVSLKAEDKYPPNTPPTRLQSPSKNPSTGDSHDQNIGSHIRDDNVERCNILRQYIQRMLHQDTDTLVNGNQNMVPGSKKRRDFLEQ